MVVSSISKIVCFAGITFVVAERTHLVIYYVFTVTCNLTLYFPFSSICGEKRSALLEIDFAYFVIWHRVIPVILVVSPVMNGAFVICCSRFGGCRHA